MIDFVSSHCFIRVQVRYHTGHLHKIINRLCRELQIQERKPTKCSEAKNVENCFILSPLSASFCPNLSLGLATLNIYYALAFWQSVARAKSQARCEIGTKTTKEAKDGGGQRYINNTCQAEWYFKVLNLKQRIN